MNMMTDRERASFRDPSGFLFTRDGCLYRQVNKDYALSYSRLMESGLFEKLVRSGSIIPHREVDVPPADPQNAYRILLPEPVPFISYPYEWTFSQLKEAALVTLAIQKRALKYNLTLKDASAYNIQFPHGRALLIDTLSFDIYIDGEPWVAYRQFCQHFLAPLALMAKRDVRLGQLSKVYIDGIPLDLASRLLPSGTRWNIGLLTHIHLHARVQKQYADVPISSVRGGRTIDKRALLGLIGSLENTVRRLVWKHKGTEWGNYYTANNYTDRAFEDKIAVVKDWAEKVRPRMIWDLGANTGLFSRAVNGAESYTVSFDLDPWAVEKNWSQVKKAKEMNILPLIMDLTNPSSAIGWGNEERASLAGRGPAGLVIALALVHHLAISNNVPLDLIARMFSRLGDWLVVEFIPKTDSQVQRLLQNRRDIFTEYSRDVFESTFSEYYDLLDARPVQDSARYLYLMKKKPITCGIKSADSV